MDRSPVALLLAAGHGRRLGGTKCLLDLGGRRALERCLDLLAGAGLSPIRVVLGAQADEVAAAIDLSATEVLVNRAPDRGQTSSLQLALTAGLDGADGFLLHTVDHPLVRRASLEALLRTWETRRPHEQIVVPSVGGRRGHPALFAAALAEEFLALPPDGPAHAVVRREANRIRHVVLEDPWLVRDIDTRDDLDAARAALGGDERPD